LTTGAINLSLYTLYIPALPSFMILSLYITAVCSVAGLLYSRKVSTKFWA
jgi:hypothetical protein